MAGGAVLNAVAFISGNYLARILSGDDPKASHEKKKRLDKDLKAYQAAYAKYQKEITKLLDWMETQHENKELAKQNFTKTHYAFMLYNRMDQDEPLKAPSEPKFSNFYQPSALQKQGELIFVGTGTLALGYAAFRFL